MNSYFLPVGLLLALGLAMLEPSPGAALHRAGLVPLMVVIIFLVNGYQVDLRRLPRASQVVGAALTAVVINLLLSPLLGLATVSLLELPAGSAMGLVVMATVPTTLTSAIVMTQLAGGNAPKALFLTILLNLVGVVSIPFMLQFALGSAGLVSISPWPILHQLVLLVLLPFAVGAFFRSLAPGHSGNRLLRYLPSSCVIGTVWASASASSDLIKQLEPGLLLLVLAGALLIHGALLLLCYLARHLYRPGYDEWLALLFTASQKTLPIALGVLSMVGHKIGPATVACLIFHFLQLFVDSMLASRLARR